MPTTTASFADIHLHTSRSLRGVVLALYSVALLVMPLFFIGLPFGQLATLLFALLVVREMCARLREVAVWQGRVQLYLDRQVGLASQLWLVEQLSLQLGWLVVLRLHCRGRRGWLLVARDSCRERDFRALHQWCRSLG